MVEALYDIVAYSEMVAEDTGLKFLLTSFGLLSILTSSISFLIFLKSYRSYGIMLKSKMVVCVVSFGLMKV